MQHTMLGTSAFDAAKEHIETTARPLEVARFRYHFDDGSREAVLAALDKYQNSDGGFGHALEPDLRTGDSSVLCTTVALQVYRAIDAPLDDGASSQAIRYLLEILDRTEAHWRIIPPSAESSPHAPWWNQAGREEQFDAFSLNPTAEVLGHLYDHRWLVPAEVLALIEERVSARLGEATDVEMHEMLCLLRLSQTRGLPDAIAEPLQQTLRNVLRETVALNPADWDAYSLRPLQVIDGPESPFIDGMEAAVAANLDYEIASQADDGSWQPTWSWGDEPSDAWDQAHREWSGVITLDKLLTLQRFDRIEGRDSLPPTD